MIGLFQNSSGTASADGVCPHTKGDERKKTAAIRRMEMSFTLSPGEFRIPLSGITWQCVQTSTEPSLKAWHFEGQGQGVLPNVQPRSGDFLLAHGFSRGELARGGLHRRKARQMCIILPPLPGLGSVNNRVPRLKPGASRMSPLRGWNVRQPRATDRRHYLVAL